MSSTVPRIVIIGAGPAGLALARTLQVKGIPATIYDADGSASERNQGGTLDLKSESGQEAIKAAQLYDEWKALARPEGQSDKISDKNYHLYFNKVPGGEEAYNPEIDRGQLRALFVENLDAEHAVKWGHKLVEVSQETPDGEWTLKFANGKTVTADFVVGADGAWSRIRGLVSQVKPEYTGITFADMVIPNIVDTHPELIDTIGDGSLFALDDHKCMITQRTQFDARVYAGCRIDEGWHKQEDVTKLSTAELHKYILDKWFQDWSPKLRVLVESADHTRTVLRVIYALPVDKLRWEHRKGVTLIGDASHVMSPFAGEGVNLAMGDAHGLAEAIAIAVSGGGSLDEEVEKMEAAMWARAEEAGDESARNCKVFFDAEAGKVVGGMFASHGAQPEQPIEEGH